MKFMLILEKADNEWRASVYSDFRERALYISAGYNAIAHAVDDAGRFLEGYTGEGHNYNST